MKKLSSILAIVLIMALVFTGCGAKTNTGQTSNEEGQKEAKKDTITVWTYAVYAEYEDELKELIAKYEEMHPNITVEYEILSWSEGPKKFATALNAGSPPDIFFGHPTGERVDTGLAVKVKDYLPEDVDLSKYDERALKYMTVDGDLYGLPLYVALHTWGGDKENMEKVGIPWQDIQKNGWTWDEFLMYCDKAQKAGFEHPFVFQGAKGNTEMFTHLVMNNGIPYAVEEGKIQYNDERTKEVFEFIETLLEKEYLPSNFGEIGPADRIAKVYARETVFFGRAIPYYDVTFGKRNASIDKGETEGEKVEFVALPIPTGPHAEGEIAYGTSDGYTLYRQVKATDEHVRNAAAFLAFLAGPESRAHAELVLAPVHKDQVKSVEGASPYNAEFANRYGDLIVPPADLTVDEAAKLSRFRTEELIPALQLFHSPDGALKDGDQAAEIFDRLVKGAEKIWR